MVPYYLNKRILIKEIFTWNEKERTIIIHLRALFESLSHSFTK